MSTAPMHRKGFSIKKGFIYLWSWVKKTFLNNWIKEQTKRKDNQDILLEIQLI